MNQRIRLDEAFNQIIDQIEASLLSEVKSDGLLEGISEIVRGDRSRPRPKTPTIWIFGETANPDHNPTTLKEKWSLPVALTSVYESNDEAEGYREATRLAALARSIILKDRTLGLRGIVQDVRSGRFEPSAPWHRQGSLFASVAVVNITFFTFE